MKKNLLLPILLAATSFPMTSCTSNPDVLYLNFKPELTDDVWNPIVEKYKEETGVQVKVQTAASGQYETTLKGLMGNRMKPTIFQINGPVGYKNWESFCYDDLSGTNLYKNLSSSSLAVTIDGKVKAIPVAEEGYGIIYNKSIFKSYYALDGIDETAKTYVNSEGVISAKSFSQLKTLVEDMQSHKSDLGLDGVFASSGLDGSTSWRITGHLFNMPLVGEFGSTTTSTPSTFNFTYADNYRNLLDLYIKNSPDAENPAGAIEKTMTAANGQFRTKKAAMIQNGNWATNDLTGTVEGAASNVATSDLAYLPLYCGDLGNNVKESTQGLCIGTESFLTVNKSATTAQQEAGIAFLEWLFTGKGQSFVTEKLGFMAPFKGFSRPTDALSGQVYDWMNNSSYTSVPWDFTLVPSTDDQRAALVTDLKAYYNGGLSNSTWNTFVSNAKSKWAELAK